MTIDEAALDLHLEYCTYPWLVRVVPAGLRLQMWTTFDLPRALKERLATWRGWPVEFKATGRECLR